MSYIEILILRRLRSGPAHGYELRKRVEQTTGFVLHNNSLYPALEPIRGGRRGDQGGQPQEGRPPRLVYTLTEVGHELLHDMLAELPPEQAADESEFLARLGQFSLLNSAERAAVLAARTRAVHEQLAHSPDDARPGHRCRRALGRAGHRRTDPPARAELAWLAELGELAGRARPGARLVTARTARSTPRDAAPAGSG